MGNKKIIIKKKTSYMLRKVNKNHRFLRVCSFKFRQIYIYRFSELDYLVEDIYCYSEFHASCEAIIRQLSKITDTCEDIQNLKIQNNA